MIHVEDDFFAFIEDEMNAERESRTEYTDDEPVVDMDFDIDDFID